MQVVCALGEEIGHIKFASGMTNLAVADKLTVHIQEQAGIYAFKIEQITVAVWLKLEGTMIQPARVLMWHKGRIERERVIDISVVMMVKTVILPIRWHGDFVLKGSIQKILWQIMIAFIIVKIPVTIEKRKIRRLLTRTNGFQRLMRNKIGVMRRGVDVKRVWILEVIW